MKVALLAMLLAACARAPVSRPPSAQPLPAKAEPPPRFCPPGTKEVGQRPPEGVFVHCERPNGIKHGPYVFWFDSGQKEEEGTYWEGEPRGRRTTWDEHGRLLNEWVFGAPITICAYDKASRRAIRHLPLELDGPKRVHPFLDELGRASVKRLPVGRYRIEWWAGTETHGPSSREVVVDAEHEQTVTLEIDASRFPPVVLGGPSRCAPR